MRYSLSELTRGLRDPHLIAREANSTFYRARGGDRFNSRGTGIFELDWDNLILLDACRFDVFRDAVDLPGELSSRNTRGSRTEEFVRANFTGEHHHDTVYVSENGWYRKLREEIDAEVYRSVLLTDDHFPTRHRETTETAKKLATDHPKKRMLVHYLPPHHPYYGSLADKHFSDVDQFDALFKRIRTGELDVSDEVLRSMYAENLARIVPYVEELLDEFTGKTVVSADHGEFLGERSSPFPVREYGHLPTTYTEELTKVPWLVHTSGPRKTITAERPHRESESDEQSAHKVDRQLRNLGYKV